VTDPLRDELIAAVGERYDVKHVVGSGGMATVYLAHDKRNKRRVALKVFRSDLSEALGEERFQREIEVAATLTHPNVLPLYDSGEVDGLLYYVMPYIEGESLAERLDREEQLPLDVAMKIAQQIAQALHHAHQQGIVHRDIKPANVLLVDDQAIVADFGIARMSGTIGASRLTTVGLSVGTPHYMSPEQTSQSDKLDGRADIYSLGCVLYEMLTGEPPFSGKTAQAVMARHAVDPVPSIRTVRGTASVGLERIVRKAMAKVPADRYATGSEMAAALERERTGQGTLPRERSKASVMRTRAALGAVALAVSAIVVSVLLPVGRSGPVDPGLDPDLIAVAPFRVTSSGGVSFADLEDGIPELMYLRLAGESGTRTVYPGTTAPIWERLAGGGSLTDSMAFRGARSVGAGRLMLGHLLVTTEEAVLNASLFDVQEGRVVAQAEDVRGPVDDILRLIDELAVQLLIRSAGEGESRVGYFVGSDLAAVRAYVAGQAAFHRSRYSEAMDHFAHALDIDSAFAMAGVQYIVASSYALTSPRRAQAERAALAGRDRLNSRDRILLDAFVNDLPSLREMLLMWDSAIALMPDRKTVRFLGADYLFHYGDAMGEVGAMSRAEAGFREVLSLDPDHAPAQAHLFELVARRGDGPNAIEIGRAYLEDRTREYLPYYQWRLDLLEGVASLETFEAARREMEEGSLYRIFLSAQTDGYDVEYAAMAAEELLAKRTNRRSAYHDMRRLALNRGRPGEAAQIRARIRSLGPERYDPLIDVFDALYWGGDPSVAERAVLERAHVDGAPSPAEFTLPVSAKYVDACAVGLWRVATGQHEAASPLVETLRDYSTETQLEGLDRTGASLCSQIIDTQLAVATGRDGADAMLARLDSLSRQQFFGAREVRVALNLTLAKLLEERGDLEGALEVLGRRRYGSSGVLQGLSTFLREEARLAAMVGQTERAIRASELYLNLRSDPEPPYVAQADSVRELLRRLRSS
jgi:tRNA A-37 threonylcarbamoyl transferase component Bud32/tetratricopeptide (TPR) repeat protein